jgi:DNA-binding transcriptional LysR family regulator
VNAFRDSPAGHLRITVPRPAARTVIEPVLSRFLRAYPSVTLEVSIDAALTDIVRDRFDAGIRPGHRVEQDMIALRVGEDARPTVVASPDYLRRHGTPEEPADLRAHNCSRMRLGGNAPQRWIFEKRGKTVEVDVMGSLISGDSELAIRAALDGVALARVPYHAVEEHISAKTLVPVLEDWRPRSVGFYLYYPSRRQMPAALQALIAMLKSESSTRRAGHPSDRPSTASAASARASRSSAQ